MSISICDGRVACSQAIERSLDLSRLFRDQSSPRLRPTGKKAYLFAILVCLSVFTSWGQRALTDIPDPVQSISRVFSSRPRDSRFPFSPRNR